MMPSSSRIIRSPDGKNHSAGQHALSSHVAILRGGGRHAAVVWEQIAPHYSQVLVWDDGDNLHPLLRTLPRFQPSDIKNNTLLQFFDIVDVEKLKLENGGGGSGDDVAPSVTKAKMITAVDCFVAVGSPTLRHELVASVIRVLDSSSECGGGEMLRCFFPSIVHSTAVVANTAELGSGCFVGPFSLINTHARVGDFCLINSAALVEHDCILGDYATLNPGAMLMGGVVVQTLTTLGANASVRENCSIQSKAVVGMGAAVVKDINGPLHGFWAGVPAKPVYTHRSDPGNFPKIRWCVDKPFTLQRFQQYLHPSLERGHLTNDGPLQAVLQSKVKTLVRSNRQVLLCSNGTAALHSLVAGHDLKHGKHIRWVTQAFTFPSSIQGPLMDSLVCDIDPKLMGPCMNFLNNHKEDFGGVIVTNVFGLQAHVLAYEQWCIDNKKLLIFDNAATPIGTVDDGRCVHDVGDAAFMSFHETKPYGRGEGGAVFVDRELAEFVHQAMNFGYDISRQIRIPNRRSSNWRMSDFAAAAICDHIDNIISNKWEERLNELARFAIEAVERSGHKIALPVRYPTVLSCLFVHLGENSGMETCRRLNSSGIEAKNYYNPLIERSDAPIAWKLFDHTVCLPFHIDISRSELTKMINMLSKQTQSF